MNIHENARLTPHGRERMVRMVLSGQTPQGRSPRPKKLRQPTPSETVERIVALRRKRLTWIRQRRP